MLYHSAGIRWHCRSLWRCCLCASWPYATDGFSGALAIISLDASPECLQPLWATLCDRYAPPCLRRVSMVEVGVWLFSTALWCFCGGCCADQRDNQSSWRRESERSVNNCNSYTLCSSLPVAVALPAVTPAAVASTGKAPGQSSCSERGHSSERGTPSTTVNVTARSQARAQAPLRSSPQEALKTAMWQIAGGRVALPPSVLIARCRNDANSQARK